MTNRERLISLSIKYNGDYNLLKKAILNNEEVCEQVCEQCITIFDDNYPKSLLDLKYPPFVLFYKGDISLLTKEGVGVVGSRNPCSYALKATEGLCKRLNDKVIISGLAKGIDACAHENAFKTIGVLGCGIDYVYPASNYKLYERIKKEGLIISEYPSKTVPYPFHFPFRNRIIAALSKKVYIMEAHEKSGTLTTVNEALELGKEVNVLPFDIFEESGIYNNFLIQEGASMINRDEVLCLTK